MIPTIDLRNKFDTINQEHLLWRALCHESKALKPYLAPDACLMLPGGTWIDRERVDKVLERMPPWRSYRFEHEPRVTAIGMFCTAVTYTVILEDNKGKKKRSVVTTVWRQGADGEWLACLHNNQSLGPVQ